MGLTVKLALAYFAAVSVISASVTAYDKIVSKIEGHRRVPEKRLIMLAALGGSAAMLLTMLLIRHKTRHVKFMLGLPIIILIQSITVYFIIIYF